IRAMPMRFAAISLLALAFAAGAAQDGDKAEAFVDIKGATHYPLKTKESKAVVLFFITTDCPVSNYYASEISAIARDPSDKSVRCFAIHVDPELTAAAANEHAKAYGLTCPVLIDTKHHLVKAAGVTVTPEAAVFTSDGKIAYRGRIDDLFVELGKRRGEAD